MKIWYDVSDLVSWKLPHLTGIQRTTVGILNGLVEQVGDVGLVRYDVKAGRFFALTVAELPASVRCHIRDRAASNVAESETAATVPARVPSGRVASRPDRRRPSRFKMDLFRGTDGEAEELRHAFRQFKTATRQLRKSLSSWVGRRLRTSLRGGGLATPPHAMRDPTLNPLPAQDAATFIAAGDALVSIGATWGMAGHGRAVAAVRGRGVHVVRMIYDLIPTIKPQWLEPAYTRSITAWVRSVLRESDRVLTISEFSRREIERYCQESRFAPPALTVVRLGDVMEGSAAERSPAPLPRFVPGRPFFVCVSTLDVRKNHRLLYDAWTQLAVRRGGRCPDLVCIGTPHLRVADLLHEIGQDRAVNRHIHVLHGIEDSELAWYYANCSASIYPSKYEGWGLPVAESLGQGRMCLASNATSIPEISSDLPEFFDPYDVYALVLLVERVLDEPDWVQARERIIRERFRSTGWQETAAQVLGAITGAARETGAPVWPRLAQQRAAVAPSVVSMQGAKSA